MRSIYDRTRGELESALKRIAKGYAQGKIAKPALDEFSVDIEHAFQCLEEMEQDEAESDSTPG